jgi:hypothetical protein
MDERRVLRWPDYREFRQRQYDDAIHFANRLGDKANLSDLADVFNRLDVLEAEKQVPTTTAKELSMLKVRLDRIELLVGLKRDPVLTQLPNAPKIS